jgi:glycosyltransferase involved in cell wall biosynthesis
MPKVLVDLIQTTGKKGGLESYIKGLYSELAASEAGAGFEFIGLASRELAATDTSWFPGVVLDSKISGENRFSWAFGELVVVPWIAKRMGADLIHGPAMFGPARSTVPVVITIHDLSYFTHPKLMRKRVLSPFVRWMEKVGSRNARRLIASSEYSRDMIVKFLKFPESRIDLVYLAGRNQRTIPHKPSSRRTDLFLAMGQRNPYKGLETALRAWKLLKPAERPQLIITGSHGADPLSPLLARLELEDSVTLRDWISDEEIDDLKNTATALIETTLAAGFGMPALEAMAVGLPVIISDIPVFRETAGANALFFDAGNAAGLANAVVTLSSQPGLAAKLSQNGPPWASTFTWKRCAEQTIISFTRALEER